MEDTTSAQDGGRGRGRGRRTTTAATEQDLVRQNRRNTKRAVARMSTQEKSEYNARNLAKQAERVLLPDAPPRKRARKSSPNRVPCRLVEGTPTVPPPPKPQSSRARRPIVKKEVGASFSSVPLPPNPQSPHTQRPIVNEEVGTSFSSVPPPPNPQSPHTQRPIVMEEVGTSFSSVPPPPNPQSPHTQRAIVMEEVGTSFSSVPPPALNPQSPPTQRPIVKEEVGTSFSSDPPPALNPQSPPTQWSIVKEEVGSSFSSDPPPALNPQSPPTQRPIVNEEVGTSFSSVPPNPQSPHTQRPIVNEEVGTSFSSVPPNPQSPHTQRSIVRERSASPPPLLCDWTTGELRQNLLPAPQSSSASPLQQLQSPQPQVNTYCSNDGPDQPILEWLDQLSDAEEEQSSLDPNGLYTDYTTEEPAYLPEDMDDNCADFLQRQDDDADRLLSELLTRDRTEHTTLDDTTFDWTNNNETFVGQRENFVGPSGPTFTLESTDRPIDIFFKYFDDEVFNLIVTETNRNCDNLMTETFTEHSRFNRLKGTDKSEIAIFLAVLVLQGVLPLPVEKDYFKENGYLTLKYFKTLMTYNRFVILKRLLHLTNNNDESAVNNSKLRKLGPLLNLLRSKFKSLYLPSRDIAIDESLLKWHGRLSFAQKIERKAAKVGIKTYELCESSTGYCWDFFIYTGKGHTHDGHDREDIERQDTDRQETDRQGVEQGPRNLTAQIVLDLARPLLNRGHTLVMDNYYNSPLLARYLKNNKTDCFGTLRVNREFVPEAVKNTPMSMLRPGEMIQSYCRDLSVMLWRDSNIVAMISTIHAGEVGGKEKNGHYKYKPKVVLDYNLAMGGVDKKDQLLSAHPMERARNQVWYKKVFRRLLNVTILNAYIIYKTRHPRTTQREFRTSLANEMIAAFRPPQVECPLEIREVRVYQKGKRRRPILTGNHFVGAGRSKYLTCVYCKKARTKYICKQCDVSLCLEICFENYHTIG